MSFILQPWHLMFFVFAGWATRQQQEVIEYLLTENQVLKEKLGKNRILLNDDQRRRLGVKDKVLGRKLLGEFGTLFTPDTILRWHRQLVANKWDYSDRKNKQVGRPRIRQVIVGLTGRRRGYGVFSPWQCSQSLEGSSRVAIAVALPLTGNAS
jgi:hypothetical protein